MGIKSVGGPCHRKSALGCPQDHQKRREEKAPFRWGWAGGVPVLVCQPWERSWRRGFIRQMVLGLRSSGMEGGVCLWAEGLGPYPLRLFWVWIRVRAFPPPPRQGGHSSGR